MAAFTRWILRHRRLTLFWPTVMVIGILTVSQATSARSKQFGSPGQESSATNEAILRTYGIGTPLVVLVVTLPDGTTVDSAGVADQLTGALVTVATAAPGAPIVLALAPLLMALPAIMGTFLLVCRRARLAVSSRAHAVDAPHTTV